MPPTKDAKATVEQETDVEETASAAADLDEMFEDDLELERAIDDEEARQTAEKKPERKGPDAKDDSEQSGKAEEPKEEPKPTDDAKSQAAQILDLVNANSRIKELESKLQQFEAEKAKATEESDFEYDVGDLPKRYDDPEDEESSLRPVLNEMGKFQLAETRKLKRELDELKQMVSGVKQDSEVDAVFRDKGVTDAEDEEIYEFAKKHGMSFQTRKQLEAIIDTYRDIRKAREQVDEKTTPEDMANMRVRKASRSSQDETRVETQGRRTFEDSFSLAKKRTLAKLRQGKIDLT